MKLVSPSLTNIVQELAVLSQQKATGELILLSGNSQWHVYLFFGRLLYATGGIHPVRRWYRAIRKFCPSAKFDTHRLRKDEPWECQLLHQGIHQNQLNLTQAKSIISSTTHEVLFALIGEAQLSSRWLPKKQRPIALLEVKECLSDAQQVWQEWLEMGLAEVSPDLTPVFKQPPSQLNLEADKTPLGLTQLLNGNNTIWDIASLVGKPLTAVVSALQHWANQGVIELQTVSDFSIPICTKVSLPSVNQDSQLLSAPLDNTVLRTPSGTSLKLPTTNPELGTTNGLVEVGDVDTQNFASLHAFESAKDTQTKPAPVAAQPTGPLVAFIDDSRLDSLTMNDILTQAGYRFINIQNPVTALPVLLEHKPDLIFLDLVMPVTNGYEICTLIRRVSAFKDTPVIILTSNDGIVDRVRAKMIGSSSFLAKPIDREKVLKILHQYLPDPKR